MNFDDLDAERDLTKNREVIFADGAKMFIRQDDQYGFWHIHNSKGKVAEALSGSYTNFNQALIALQNYSENVTKKVIKEVNRGFGIKTDGNSTLLNSEG